MRAHIKADKHGARLILTDETSVDEAQATGHWIAAENPVEIKP